VCALFALALEVSAKLSDDDWFAASTEHTIRESGCLACHRTESPLADRLAPIPAPNLHSSGPRYEPVYLRAFLSSPSETKPGTTMPDLLAGYPKDQRAEIVEDLVHYLGSRGGLFDRSPIAVNLKDAEVGEELFFRVGCAVCHPRDGIDAWKQHLAEKTNFRHISELLEQPVSLIPAGHMPSLRLSEDEIQSLTKFLLEDQSKDEQGEPIIREVKGLRQYYYEGVFRNCELESLTSKNPTRVSYASKVSLPDDHREDHFATRLEGEILIPKTGAWTFTLYSDDGSRLWIDSVEVIDHDGEHSPTSKEGVMELSEGWHSLRVTMYEYGGGEELELSWEGPGQEFSEVPAEQFRHRSSAYEPRGNRLKIDRDRRARGQRLYLSLGCASCHDRGVPPREAPGLEDLPFEASGCISTQQGADSKAPRFHFTMEQTRELAKFLAARESLSPTIAPARRAEVLFDQLNCFMCHSRNGRGGPSESNREFFTGTAELGDEGCLPPDLTNVGAKLQAEWLQEVIQEGKSVRPYMNVRMPAYHQSEGGDLAELLFAVDGGKDQSESELTEEIIEAGRHLTGENGFRCIDCHEFAGHPSLGEPAIDLATTGERLQAQWYQEYMLDPQSKRPGTRMPGFWAAGLDLFPEVLDGTAGSQVDATWSYLSMGDTAPLPRGLVIDRSDYDLIPVDEPILFGTFFEDLSARVICCGYPERISFAYDVENTRMAMLWQGEFMNARGTWEGRAGQLESPEGSQELEFPAGEAIALIEANQSWPAALGRNAGWRHRAVIRDAERRPIFRRSHADWGVTVEEWIEPKYSTLGAKIIRHVQVEGVDQPLVFRVATADRISKQADGSYEADDGARYSLGGSGEHIVYQGEDGEELRVILPQGNSSVEVEVVW